MTIVGPGNPGGIARIRGGSEFAEIERAALLLVTAFVEPRAGGRAFTNKLSVTGPQRPGRTVPVECEGTPPPFSSLCAGVCLPLPDDSWRSPQRPPTATVKL